jgi:ParB family chromosome partitioning protein
MATRVAKRGLGKGLDSMIPAKVQTPVKEKKIEEKHIDGQIVNLKTTELVRNPEQPRRVFDEDEILELGDSLKQHGMINPIIVTPRDGNYMIVAGERRWRAAKKIDMKEVPVIIKDLDDQQVAELSIIDNLQRVDVNPIDEALAFQQLIDTHNYTQEKLAKTISKSRVYVTNSLRLLKLCDRVREMVIQGMLSTGHARALIPVEDPEEQTRLAEEVFDKKKSVRETEKMVKDLGKTKTKKTKAKNESIDAVYAQLSEKCKQAIGTKVEISSKGDGKGKIEIEFYSTDDLEKITGRLCRE